MAHPHPADSPSPPTTSIIELENPSVDNSSLSTQEGSPSFHSITPLEQTMDGDSPALSALFSVASNHIPLAQMMDDES
jgi:hypothetical protein